MDVRVDFKCHCAYLSLHSDLHEQIFTCLPMRALADSVRNDDCSPIIVRDSHGCR